MTGNPLRPLENVEINFSKIYLKIFANNIIFFIAELFYTNKMRMSAKTRLQKVKI